MADTLEIAMCVRDLLADYGAELAFAPQFDLKDLDDLKVVVVPSDLGLKLNTRATLEEETGVEVGFLKKAEYDDLPGLIRLVTETSEDFLGLHVCGAVCTEAKFAPLYSPEHLRERRQFTSVLALKFRRLADASPH